MDGRGDVQEMVIISIALLIDDTNTTGQSECLPSVRERIKDV